MKGIVKLRKRNKEREFEVKEEEKSEASDYGVEI